jgi:hypothetical protein
MFIEFVEQGDDLRVIESLVAEPLADVGPVFLFDVGVIILVIGTASGELDGLFSLGKMFEEVVIEEFGSVVTVEAK